MYRIILTLSRAMAYLGGLMLTLLILLTCVSVLGRSLNGVLHGDFMQSAAPGFADWLLARGVGPINGDFELIEAGVAFAIFAFLPLCHLTGGHASVDIFTARMLPRTNRILSLLIGLIFAAVMVLIAVQLFSGLQSKIRSGQTTFILGFPVWWAYLICLSGAVLSGVVAVYVAVMRLVELSRGHAVLPVDTGADH